MLDTQRCFFTIYDETVIKNRKAWQKICSFENPRGPPVAILKSVGHVISASTNLLILL